MNTGPGEHARFRASDAERERAVAVLQKAAQDGRLTLMESDKRMTAAYAAKFREDLSILTEDLPDDAEENPSETASGSIRSALRLRPALRLHVMAILTLTVFLVARWASSGAPFFWPAFPLLWLLGSLMCTRESAAGGGYRVTLRCRRVI